MTWTTTTTEPTENWVSVTTQDELPALLIVIIKDDKID